LSLTESNHEILALGLLGYICSILEMKAVEIGERGFVIKYKLTLMIYQV